jgi:hypothetical protein
MKKTLLFIFALGFSSLFFCTCTDCGEDFPIMEEKDLPNPFRVLGANFDQVWFITFNKAVDFNTLKGKINLRVPGSDVAFSGFYEVIQPTIIRIQQCEFARTNINNPPSLKYTLELSGDGDTPIRSTNGQRLDGDYDGTDGGVYRKETMHGDCSENEAPVVQQPDNNTTTDIKVNTNDKIIMEILFNFRMERSSFELGKTVFVTDKNGQNVPCAITWSNDWQQMFITTNQSKAQFCSGNSCSINVKISKNVTSAFDNPMESDYSATFNIF